VIVFDLRCGADHVFEAWFGSNADWEAQRDGGQVACPLCGDTALQKAAMAPAVPAKTNQGRSGAPAELKAALQALAAAQSKALEGSTWVGDAFASQARAMHLGEEAHRTIHGRTTLAEAKTLVEEGVPVAPLPFPVTPPEALN
jgi:hypothetical protein